jgi:hypothetical protein
MELLSAKVVDKGPDPVEDACPTDKLVPKTAAMLPATTGIT